MQGTLRGITKILACPLCNGDIVAASTETEFLCKNCGRRFKTINGVPCFVGEDLANFTEIASEEREQFLAMKRVAYGEDSFVSRIYNNYHRYAARKRSECGNIRITVDVGFGVGEHYPFITEKEKRDSSFIGIDLDRFKLEHFSAQHPEIPVMQATAFRLPFADCSVDFIQLLATLEHFYPEEISGLLNELLRILKPGGGLVACYPAEGGVLLKMCQAVMHVYLKGRTGFDLDKGAIHRHLAGAQEIRTILGERRDLERIETAFYPFVIKSVNLSLFVNELYRKR